MSELDYKIEAYKNSKLTSKQIENNVELELNRLIKESYEVHYIGLHRDEIKLLEKIRGRPYSKCTICNEDLTLRRCKHHSKGGQYYNGKNND